MAFFDEMDRKLSQFGQSVSNKSREVSEGMRLSSAIKAEEEKQNNLYREVGKYYFENCAANAEGQLKVLCDQIVASMELTSQYKQQQNVLKGMVSCPNCGAQISANSGFCNVCGSKIEKQVSPAPQPGAGKICPKCQKTVEADALFCTFCGNQFEAQPAAPAYEEPAAPAYEEPATPAYEEPAAPAYEEPAAPVYEEPAAPAYEEVHIPEVTVPTCVKCGAVLEEGQKFCTVCGTKVEEEPAAPVYEEPAAPAYEEPVTPPYEEVHIPEVTVPTCVKCGAVLEEGQKFCTVCGTKVEEEPAAPVYEEPAAPVQHMQSLTCRSCGAALEEGQKFCTKCGTPVA
ncbi:zinc-ribbon domain-containing protein [[Ruminococcus] lactaris]|uniref:zinc ribbon domain-containing protein n=1 Tax=[Ruminococcus] lactaris TaxID=46228 RepID=UPI0032C10050